ncbi:MAG: NAD-dependent epimerase/dehydratase family protein [Panacagrimonas sp.]
MNRVDPSCDNLIIGCGDVGRRVARRLRERGESVHAVVRSTASRDALTTGEGIAASSLDLDSAMALPQAERVFWFAPPPDRGNTDPRIRSWLDGLRHPPRRIVYISTSGVYGDCEGRWIDETETLNPRTDRGRRRLDAEFALRQHAGRSAVVILRVPGIYGPGRLPTTRLRSGLAVVREEESPYTNRIHSEDLASVALAAVDRGTPGQAYNVSDGHPTTMSDYFLRCARLLGWPEPPRVSLAEARTTFTPALLSFLDESKRLINRRMIEELGVTLRYPSLDEGLASCAP